MMRAHIIKNINTGIVTEISFRKMTISNVSAEAIICDIGMIGYNINQQGQK